jgi:hypothetical protein
MARQRSLLIMVRGYLVPQWISSGRDSGTEGFMLRLAPEHLLT